MKESAGKKADQGGLEMVQTLYDFKRDLSKRGIFLSFSGPISQDLMVEMGATLKQKMKLEDASKSSVLRVFAMVVENAQNIIHYSAEKYPRKKQNEKACGGEDPVKCCESEELSLGIITVGYEEGYYFVLCGNMIENEKVKGLKEKLSKLQGMNKDELKQFYKAQRKQKPDKTSKGGGLGFIEMARKASRPIEFDFKKIDEDLSFFSVKIII